MLEVKSKNGNADILIMDGSDKEIIGDIGAITQKVLLTIANSGAVSPEEVFMRYGILARQLVDYIDTTVKRVDELGK